jgi:dihydropteroate synthase
VAFDPRRPYRVPLPGGGVLELGERPLVMGILNVTPDSFGDVVHLTDPDAAVEAALRMQDEGADLIDVGGESTRPGAPAVDTAEELARVIPVVRRLAGRLRVPLSVDTYKADVARAALDAGAAIVNDISGLQYDDRLAGVVASAGGALVLMHTRGRSRDMYRSAAYGDVIAEVVQELDAGIARARAAGVDRDRVIVDPGIGFAKRAPDSYGVLARLPELAAALDRPVLVGPSRKSFMQDALGGLAPASRDWGTAAAVAAAVLAGAHIVRVHAPAEMSQVVRVAEEIRRAQVRVAARPMEPANGIDR